ncbi:MAG: c-type cytochrome [Rhodocyclales bacterium]|nr:c-type cytochrome [Rhodocyclales bacterium]
MKVLVTAVAAISLLSAAPAFADQALAKSKNCLACHSVDKKVVGPAFKDIAAKYAGQDVVAALVTKVQKGGSGVWGPVPMPPNPAVSADEAKKLVEWVLATK